MLLAASEGSLNAQAEQKLALVLLDDGFVEDRELDLFDICG